MTKRKLVAACGLVVLAAMTGCRVDSITGNDDAVSGNGTVHYVPLEGGFYAIQADDNRNYDPMNLPSEFRQDGVTIHFSGRVRDDMMSVHMYGRIIELDHVALR